MVNNVLQDELKNLIALSISVSNGFCCAVEMVASV